MVDMVKCSFVKNINSKNYLISQSREENMASPKKKQNWKTDPRTILACTLQKCNGEVGNIRTSTSYF